MPIERWVPRGLVYKIGKPETRFARRLGNTIQLISPAPVCCTHPHRCTYTVAMKISTLSVDENVLAAVRRHAAECNSTGNALVREYLTGLAAHQDRAKSARARLRQLSEQSEGLLGKKTWTREDLHGR